MDREVENSILSVTIDGEIYGSSRKTGKICWHLEVDRPVVEIIYTRANISVLDESYSPIDHYIWSVEPTDEGAIYVRDTTRDIQPRALIFTMKDIVEVLAPYAGADAVYVGAKKNTTMVSFGPLEDGRRSLLRQNVRYSNDDEACDSTSSVTLRKTEYVIEIKGWDGMPTATLKYTEWSPTSLDIDLSFQYNVSKDCRYIATGHGGQISPLDNPRYQATTSLFGQEFSSPAAVRHFVCHPTQKKAVGIQFLAALTTPVINKIKSLPQTATKSMIDFIRNPIFIILLVVVLVYKIRSFLPSARSW